MTARVDYDHPLWRLSKRELVETIIVLREALGFYAEPGNWTESDGVDDSRSPWTTGVIEAEDDAGARARTTLFRTADACPIVGCRPAAGLHRADCPNAPKEPAA